MSDNEGNHKKPIAGDTSASRVAARKGEAKVLFDLEDHFPQPVGLFAPYSVSLKGNPDVLICIDTNALLLPYSIGKGDLNEVATVYKRLAKENRLFIPARVAREFIRRRDRQLADIIQRLNDTKSRLLAPPRALPFLLDGLQGYADMQAAAQKIEKRQQEYGRAIDRIVAQIKDWRGNDPVSTLYQEVFGQAQIVMDGDDRAKISDDWTNRLNNRTPPGYKDSAKDDTGIGDYLIWKSILTLGALHKRDLVFVTGEEKADWFVRASGGPIYPRPELVDEYRRHSGGSNLRLSSLADALDELNAPGKVVEEVREAEEQANAAPNLTSVFGSKPLSSIVQENYTVSAPLAEFSQTDRYSVSAPGAIDLPVSPIQLERRILYFPNLSPHLFSTTWKHMMAFPVKPFRRIKPVGSIKEILFLEYGPSIAISAAEAVERYARLLDRQAAWIDQNSINMHLWAPA